ncbi:MAG: TlpA disulfide reductase family protein [Cytophagales bacterium]
MKYSISASIFTLIFVTVFAIKGFSTEGGIIDENLRKPAPDFTFKDKEGNDVSLSDFKGKVVYMDLWGSWCKPCIKEMPKSKELREKIGNSDKVVFLYVAVLEPAKEKWLKANEKFEIGGVSLISNDPEGTDFRNFYDRGAVPWYYLIDKKGRIADIKAKRPSEDGIADDIKKLIAE